MTTSVDEHAFDVAPAVRQALTEFQGERPVHAAWRGSALFRSIRRSGVWRNDRQVVNHLLVDSIARVAQANPLHARVLHLRFLDRYPIHRVAGELNLAESTVYVYQRAAIESLVEVVAAQEVQARATTGARLAQRLPLAAHTQLVGRDQRVEDLLGVVAQAGPPWLIAIEGIGGIGKTALAHALLARAGATGLVDEIAWVTAKDAAVPGAGHVEDAPALTQHGLVQALLGELMPDAGGSTLSPAQAQEVLAARLQQTPHLIVVDNLETVGDWDTLLPTLRRLANPTRFVLTTRTGLAGEAGVFRLHLEELSLAHALNLLRQEASLSNLPEVVAADDLILQPVYAVVGGNPLALRLVVGLLHVQALPTIMQDLREARGMAVDQLYTFIYRRAWESLDEMSRHALLNMVLLPPQGDSLEYLDEICELPADELRTALQHLVLRNLVEVRGDLLQRTYAIHGLTRTFLLKQVIKWL